MRDTSSRLRIGLLAGGLGLAAVPALAQGGSAEDAVAPPVSLESLMRLPEKTGPAPQLTKGGATRVEWERRFAQAHSDIEDAKSALASSQREVEQLATGDQWQMAAPGASAGSENSPLSFKLREQMRSQREELEVAERGLTELRIDANLAGVPEDWQTPGDRQ